MSKVNNKDTQFWTYFASSPSVSIIDFEDILDCWDETNAAASMKIIFLNMNPDVGRASTYGAANYCVQYSGLTKAIIVKDQ